MQGKEIAEGLTKKLPAKWKINSSPPPQKKINQQPNPQKL